MHFEDAGYKTKYLIANLGSTFLYLVAILFLVISIPIFEALGSKISKFKRLAQTIRLKMMWNGVVRFIL